MRVKSHPLADARKKLASEAGGQKGGAGESSPAPPPALRTVVSPEALAYFSPLQVTTPGVWAGATTGVVTCKGEK